MKYTSRLFSGKRFPPCCPSQCAMHAFTAQDGDAFKEIGAAFKVKGDLKNALSSFLKEKLKYNII